MTGKSKAPRLPAGGSVPRAHLRIAEGVQYETGAWLSPPMKRHAQAATPVQPRSALRSRSRRNDCCARSPARISHSTARSSPPLLVVVCDLVRVRSVGSPTRTSAVLSVPDSVDALTLHSRRVLRAGVRAGTGRRCHQPASTAPPPEPRLQPPRAVVPSSTSATLAHSSNGTSWPMTAATSSSSRVAIR